MFNSLCIDSGLEWRGVSRGLHVEMADGALSPYTAEALEERTIPLELTAPHPQPLTDADLIHSPLTIAMKRSEHRPMMRRRFPFWTDRIRYWEIDDIDYAPPRMVIPEMESRVVALVRMLEEGCAAGVSAMPALEY